MDGVQIYKRLQSHDEETVCFSLISPPGTHLIKLRWMKGWVNLGATQWFELRIHGLEIQLLNHHSNLMVLFYFTASLKTMFLLLFILLGIFWYLKTQRNLMIPSRYLADQQILQSDWTKRFAGIGWKLEMYKDLFLFYFSF